MIKDIVDEVLAEAGDDGPDVQDGRDHEDDLGPRSSLKAHIGKRIGGQRVLIIPPEKSVIEAFNDGTYYETDDVVNLEGWR